MTPKTTPRKIKNLNSEDLNGENPKSRSLKKRADRAAANAARYSVTRKPSSKKKPKKKMLKSCEVLTDYYEETSMVSNGQYIEEPKLTMGDFLQEMVVNPQCPSTCMEEEEKTMENCNVWPMIPTLTGKDLLTKQMDALDATQYHYRTHLYVDLGGQRNLDAAPIMTTKLSRGAPFTCPKTGLVDLDLTQPCTRISPCLLDKLSINDNVSMVCFECHESNRIMNYFDVPDFDAQNYFFTQ